MKSVNSKLIPTSHKLGEFFIISYPQVVYRIVFDCNHYRFEGSKNQAQELITFDRMAIPDYNYKYKNTRFLTSQLNRISPLIV